LLPSLSARRRIGATRLSGNEPDQLRKLAYVVSPQTLKGTQIAATDQGVFVLAPALGQSIPLGDLYAEAGDRLFVALGYELTPRLAPELLLESMQVPATHLLFVHADGTSSALPKDRFSSLAEALLEPSAWTTPTSHEFSGTLETKLPSVWLDALGLRPLKGAGVAP
jgi:hypothetical protein